MRKSGLVVGMSVTAAALLVDARPADACGCLSPPAVAEGEYAVNQRAEQIIFEVEPNWVTAHVLIKYAGDPAKFAWIVPVPEVPELSISPLSAFGLLDRDTAPIISVADEDICPISEYRCAFAKVETCSNPFGGDDSQNDPGPAADAGASGDGGSTPPVDVIDTKVVGDYQTVTFRASEAGAATQWLRDNGFIVNSTTSIYMESYVNANMVFVAAKLVPGAGAASIKPLRMRYRAAFPSVPLVLTAVAAEPHLTVTSFIYANTVFKPQGHPVVQISRDRIARDATGRTNYPMVLARTVDEAGGDGFVTEFAGAPVRAELGNGFCCDGTSDNCNVANDAKCQCPRAEFDYADCKDTGDIVDGVKLLDALGAKYSTVTRITTRVSAEEMTFDPAFEADFAPAPLGRLQIAASQPSLASCASEVVDKAAFARLTAAQSCATTYCGAGQCVTTAAGPGCACDAGYVAQRFSDLDGLPSVTCVPQTPPVDLRAGGDVLPDACATASCGAGVCMDRNGVAVCACNTDAAAVAGQGDNPICDVVIAATATPGGQDYSSALRTLEVCAPAPPVCGASGWLVKQTSPRPGVACGAPVMPTEAELTPKPDVTCGSGCGGCSTDGSPIGALVGGAWVAFALGFVRRRRR